MDAAFKEAMALYSELQRQQPGVEEDLRRLLATSARDAEPVVPLHRGRLRRLHAARRSSERRARLRPQRQKAPRSRGAFSCGPRRRATSSACPARIERRIASIGSSSAVGVGARRAGRTGGRGRGVGSIGRVASPRPPLRLQHLRSPCRCRASASLSSQSVTEPGKAMMRPTMMSWMTTNGTAPQ